MRQRVVRRSPVSRFDVASVFIHVYRLLFSRNLASLEGRVNYANQTKPNVLKSVGPWPRRRDI
jgi:hypothetical protein